MIRSFITHTTENYESITLNLVKSIKKYSNYKIVVYTIDYDGSDNLKKDATCIRLNLGLPELNEEGFIDGENGNIYVNRQTLRTYLTLGAKVDVMLDACSYFDEWVYIDSDSIANSNVDDLFSYCGLITDFPLATLGPHEFVLILNPDGSLTGNPFWKENGTIDYENTLEWQLMKFMGLSPNQRSQYKTTNILVGSSKVKDFLKTWKDTKDLLPKIVNLPSIAPYHEETIYNVLCWKINHNHAEIPLSYINVDGSSTLTHFFNTQVNEKTTVKGFYTIPKDKSEVKVFHGEKRQSEIDKMFEIIDSHTQPRTRVLFLAPHLSTGGMPAFLLKRIQSLLEYGKDLDLYVVEFSNHSDHYVVQKNKIKELLPQSHFWTLGEDKMELVKIIEENKFDIIHFDEMIEAFDCHNPIPTELMNYLYKNDRTWRIVETCHNIVFNPSIEKHFHPEAYAYCSPWHKERTFKEMPSYGEVIEFPIEAKIPSSSEKTEARLRLGFDLDKKHVISVGLWTPGKNQKEGVELARLIEKSNPEHVFHFIGNQAPNFQEYWEPIMKELPSNVKVWGERSDTDLFFTAADAFMFNSTWECNPLVLREAISYGLPTISRNLPQYLDMFTGSILPIDNDINKIKETLLSVKDSGITNYQVSTDQVRAFAEKHINLYNKIMKEEINTQEPIDSELQVFQHFVNNPFLELKGTSDKIYKVEFFDENGVNAYTSEIGVNHWVKLNRSYFTKWRTRISYENQTIYEETLSLENKRVYISIDSRSLGDSVAWIPYMLEFKNAHNCKLIVSTFWNNLFEKEYPEIEFITPGTVVSNIYAMYRIGWFNNPDMEPVKPNTVRLQEAASNILGLEFKEIKPKINFTPGKRPFAKRYVAIANESTSGLKYWNNPTGWKELTRYLLQNGYEVVNVSKNGDPIDGVVQVSDNSIENTMNTIYHSDLFIGLSSGLSWLAWALGKKVVMISNFTKEDHEFVSDCIRITNPSVCNGCWNNPNFMFDKGDWYWCPIHKNTERQFECHKSITAKMVIDSISEIIEAP
jgi:autotransporter strand-loop-strand O-heptosyltransferase